MDFFKFIFEDIFHYVGFIIILVLTFDGIEQCINAIKTKK